MHLDLHTSAVRGAIGGAVTIAALAAVAAVTLAALFLTDGNVLAALLPTVGIAFVYVLVKVPLSWTASALVFLLLALEVSSDAAGLWSSPLVHLGDTLQYGFGKFVRVPVAGYEVLVVFLLGVAATRRMKGDDAAVRNTIPTAGIMRDALLLFLAGFLFSLVISLANGHGPAIWKARYLVHIYFFFLFFQIALQRPEDYRAIGVAVVAAAHVKAFVAAYVQLVAAPALTGGRLAFATNHGDSILFAVAVLLLILPALETGSKKHVWRLLLLLPIPIWGMLLNNRRLVWAILAMAMAIIFLATSRRPWKMKAIRLCVIGAPILALYVGVGWKNTDMGGIFRPVGKIRTMLDPTVDRSTLWRDRETWNIAYTIRNSPVVGVGLGGEYTEYLYLDDISLFYKEYRAWPHNTVLGLLLLAGLPGFLAMWLPYVIIVFLAIRAERMASTAEERIGATVSIGAIVACLAIAWGDTGSHHMQYKLATALAMALVAKLAVSTGAWPSPTSRP